MQVDKNPEGGIWDGFFAVQKEAGSEATDFFVPRDTVPQDRDPFG